MTPSPPPALRLRSHAWINVLGQPPCPFAVDLIPLLAKLSTPLPPFSVVHLLRCSSALFFRYRKIQNLELDELFNAYIKHPVFEQACRRSYGDGAITAFRIMFFNKPAGFGTALPWHQDRWQHLDTDPLLTVRASAGDCAARSPACVAYVVGGSRALGTGGMARTAAVLTSPPSPRVPGLHRARPGRRGKRLRAGHPGEPQEGGYQ